MSILQKLDNVRIALLQAAHSEDVNVYNYTAYATKKKRYIVWAVDGSGGSFNADNNLAQQVLHGTVDFFTADAYDPMPDKIQDALKAAGIAMSLNTVQYETETEMIHWEWFWECK